MRCSRPNGSRPWTCFTKTILFIKIEILRKFLRLWLWLYRNDHVTNLHTSCHLRGRDLDNIMTGPDHNLSFKSNLYVYKIWIMRSYGLWNGSQSTTVVTIALIMDVLRAPGGHMQPLCHRVCHYSDVIMGAMAFQITSLTIVYSTVYSSADQRKHQSSASLAFVLGIHRWPVNSLHKCQ